MKNIGPKLALAVLSIAGLSSLAMAGQTPPTPLPEPGTFGMFAGAIAVALIISRIIKK